MRARRPIWLKPLLADPPEVERFPATASDRIGFSHGDEGVSGSSPRVGDG